MAIVETDRFIIRPFEAQDIDFLDQLHSDEEVMRYILGRVRSHEENVAYLDRLLQREQDHGIGQRMVIRKQDNQPVGRCGLSFFYGIEQQGMMSYEVDPTIFSEDEQPVRVVELGYTFLREYWGMGYASEAAGAMRHYGLEVQKLPEIHSIIQKPNGGSVAVAEKIGAQLLGECVCLGEPGWDYLSHL